MQVHRLAEGVVVYAPAKLNLFFEVLARRDDGYHEIETLMCPVDLYDTLYFREEPTGQFNLKCETVFGTGRDARVGSGGSTGKVAEAEILPQGRDNLVWQAVEALRRREGVRSGASLRLVKRIPTAAGLGGGSSDAAAALVAANEGWGLNRPASELMRVAAELGSDVPFFLVGGPAICRGRGERIEPVETVGGLHFVVVRPPDGLATKSVYAQCIPAERPRELAPLLSAFSQGNIEHIGQLLFNRLQPAAEKLSPWIERLEYHFRAEDLPGYGMSGSGTSYFGLCRHASHARCVARRLEANGVGSVFAVRSCR